MSIVVSVRDIVNEMAEIGADRMAFLNRKTGELITLTEEQRDAIENGHPADDDLSTLGCELREVVRSGDLVELPSKFEHQEYSIVERFCSSVRDGEARQQLLKAIRGKRAFRDFNAAIQRLGVKEDWCRFRDRAFEVIAIGWLEKNNIPYDRAA